MRHLKYPKSLRLLTAADFSSLRNSSRHSKFKSFVVYFNANSRGYSRLGLSVSAKFGKSVYRNRLKRLLREQFRNTNLRNSGHDFMFVLSTRVRVNSENLESFEFQFSKDLSAFINSF